MSIRKWIVEWLGGEWPDGDCQPARLWTRENELVQAATGWLHAAGINERAYVRVNSGELGPYKPRLYSDECWDRVVIHMTGTDRVLCWMYIPRTEEFVDLVRRLVDTAKDVLDERLSRDKRRYGLRWISDSEAELVVD